MFVLETYLLFVQVWFYWQLKMSFPPDVERKEKPTQDTIREAYDLVIEITSLNQLRSGWKIFGKHWNELPEEPSRYVGVIGDFKAGKSFLIGLLHSKPDSIPHDETVHTRGFCLKLPQGYTVKKETCDAPKAQQTGKISDAKALTEAAQKTPGDNDDSDYDEDDDQNSDGDSRQGDGGDDDAEEDYSGFVLPDDTPSQVQDSSASPDLILLDTPGTDQPVNGETIEPFQPSKIRLFR